MALYVTIAINKNTIHTFGAQNMTGNPTGQNTYRVCKYVPDPKHEGVFTRKYLSGNVFHNREDGAIVLAKKVLDFVMLMEAAGET